MYIAKTTKQIDKGTLDFYEGKKYTFLIFLAHVIPGLVLGITWLLPIIPGPILISVAVSLTAAGMDLTLDLCHVCDISLLLFGKNIKKQLLFYKKHN